MALFLPSRIPRANFDDEFSEENKLTTFTASGELGTGLVEPIEGKLKVSCGTITIDLEKGLILTIFNTRNNYNIVQLPKGGWKRGLDADFAATAVRETTEETGVAVELWPLKVLDGRKDAYVGTMSGPDAGIRKDVHYFAARTNFDLAALDAEPTLHPIARVPCYQLPLSKGLKSHERLTPYLMYVKDVLKWLRFDSESQAVAELCRLMAARGELRIAKFHR